VFSLPNPVALPPPSSFVLRTSSAIAMTIEKERDSNVYMAKVAEQAERYDG
jgi:hypothetical protein